MWQRRSPAGRRGSARRSHPRGSGNWPQAGIAAARRCRGAPHERSGARLRSAKLDIGVFLSQTIGVQRAVTRPVAGCVRRCRAGGSARGSRPSGRPARRRPARVTRGPALTTLRTSTPRPRAAIDTMVSAFAVAAMGCTAASGRSPAERRPAIVRKARMNHGQPVQRHPARGGALPPSVRDGAAASACPAVGSRPAREPGPPARASARGPA